MAVWVIYQRYPRPSPGTSRKGKGREKPTPATIPSVEDDNDEWELPQLRPSQLDQYDDMFDRILGIAPSKRKAKANTSRSTNVTATRKRARAQAAANADSQADSAQGAKKRKTTQPKPSTSSSSVAPRTSQPLTRLTHDAGHNSHRRQPAPFPGLSSSNHLDTPSLSHAIPKPRPVAARQAPLTAYPSSSQDSVSGGFLADVVIFKDLTSRKR
ncbi:hypothetical protein NM688_g3655 [Phlebia brevispora]|uniref:Uncharacterized protein n=1 Tax=Phlebia brevispora TaxID=194682 RepID=A0ACC1T5A8_9APHY|nr:hypothetical protein NM688_g3655 [Phlebia brevispora]